MTMARPSSSLTVALALALLAAGCIEFKNKTTVTAPSDLSGLGALLGNWTSSSVIPSAESCTDFQWNVTEQQGNTASGTFRASCPGGLTLAGTAQGTLFGSNITWTANGNATASGLPSCAFTLTGTAHLEGDRVRVPYSGQTCLGPVRGEEWLTRR